MRTRLRLWLKAIKIVLTVVHAIAHEILEAPWLRDYHNPGPPPDPILPDTNPRLDPKKGK